MKEGTIIPLCFKSLGFSCDVEVYKAFWSSIVSAAADDAFQKVIRNAPFFFKCCT